MAAGRGGGRGGRCGDLIATACPRLRRHCGRPPCFLDPELRDLNDDHGDPANIFPDQAVFLDSATQTYIEELGGMNLFFVMKDGRIVTPSLTGSILEGVTRASILELSKEIGLDPREERIEAWSRLARDLDVSKLERMTREIGLGEVVDTAAALLDGKERGRIVVNVDR